MKPRISLDFLRGLLTAYAGHECYMYAIISPAMIERHAAAVVLALIVSAVLIGIHLFVIAALLAQRASKTVFVFLLLSVLAAFLPFLDSGFGRVPFAGGYVTVRSAAFWLVHVAVAVLAYAYYRAASNTQRSNQTMQRTAGSLGSSPS